MAGTLIAASGIDAALWPMLGLVGFNLLAIVISMRGALARASARSSHSSSSR